MRIVQYINPPPPIGGVTSSVENLYNSLKHKDHEVYYKREFSVFDTYDIGHIHSSNKFKRLFQIIFLKIFCKKVIFTVHGLWFNNNAINRLTLKLAHGVIFLNKKIHNKWINKTNCRITILPNLFREGILKPKQNNENQKTKKSFLLYSQSRTFDKGQEVYGIEFALKSIEKLGNSVKVILVDLDAGYIDLVKNMKDKIDIDYFPHPVDFKGLLSKCDVYIRPTCMDGSSIAIQEALLLGKRVIASDVVDRDPMVDTYEHLNENSFLAAINNQCRNNKNKFKLSSVSEYLSFIDNL